MAVISIHDLLISIFVTFNWNKFVEVNCVHEVGMTIKSSCIQQRNHINRLEVQSHCPRSEPASGSHGGVEITEFFNSW